MGKILTAIFALLPIEAYARGGYHGNSPFGQVTAIIVVGILLLLFSVSVFVSIKEKGIIKGFIEHKVIQLIFFYIAMLVGVCSVFYLFLE